MPDKDSAPQVDQAVRVLRLIEERNSRGMSARELVSDLDVSKSTIQRVLVSLEAGGLLQCDPDGKYRLSHRVLALADAYFRSTDLRGVAMPFMRKLEHEVNETVVLSVQSDGSRITILQVESPHEIRYRTSVGRTYPLWAGASGWLLAYAGGPALVEQTIASFRDSLPETEDENVRDERAARLRSEIELSGARGWAITRGTWTASAAGISVPLQSTIDGADAVLTVYGPDARLSEDREDSVRAALTAVAREIDGVLGMWQ